MAGLLDLAGKEPETNWSLHRISIRFVGFRSPYIRPQVEQTNVRGNATCFGCTNPNHKAKHQGSIRHLRLATSTIRVYSIKSGYAIASALKHHHNHQPESQYFHWVKDIWSGKLSPKPQVFLWSIIQRALPTGENLQTRGITSDLSCPRCKEPETSMHIFFECPFARKVWNFVPLRQAVPTVMDDTKTSMKVKFRYAICLPPTGMANFILPWTLRTIWTARNILLFEDKGSTPEEVATKGISLTRE